MVICEGGKQYNRKADLWEAIKPTMLEIEPAEVKKIDKIKGCYITCCYLEAQSLH